MSKFLASGGRLSSHPPPPAGKTLLCETNLDDSIDSENFYVRGDFPLI